MSVTLLVLLALLIAGLLIAILSPRARIIGVVMFGVALAAIVWAMMAHGGSAWKP